MKRWRWSCLVFCLWFHHLGSVMSLLPGKNVLNIIPEILGSRTTDLTDVPTTSWVFTTSYATKTSAVTDVNDRDLEPPDQLYPVQYAGLPREMKIYPLPLRDSDHELMLNVSWIPPFDSPARDYSLEVRSLTDTVDCKTALMCYEYNIPGNSMWWLVPAFANPVAESCAVRPGCAYAVILTAHPWDGHTVTEKIIELDECVAGVCSCAHSPRLPAPLVSAGTVVIQGEIFVNITWTLPKPQYPQRLPRNLQKQSYAVSISKQMVTDAHPAPWFANTIFRRVDAAGPVSTGDSLRWLLLPMTERSSERSAGRIGPGKNHVIELDVKLLARVNLVDERGCVGPAGNATAYDPAKARQKQFGTYMLWAVIGGLCVLAMVAFYAMSSRIVKRALFALRPAAVSTPLTPLRQRPAWLSLHMRSYTRRRPSTKSQPETSDSFPKLDINTISDLQVNDS